MIEMDSKKKADVELATRLAGFASSTYPTTEEGQEDTSSLLTQIVTEVEDQKFEDSLYLEMASEMSKKHRAVSADMYDDEESEIERNSYMYIPKKHDQVDEEFSRIQDEDMQAEKYNDRQQQVLNAQREHDAFMRRLDKKGLSAVTHDKDTTTLDVISDSLSKKEHSKPRPSKKISEVEKSAGHLADSLRDHQLFENHQLSQSSQELNLDNQSEETINQIQSQIEARVQMDLEQLAVIANNKFGGGKRVYDY